ncbi:L,D-transpeptidase [Nocardia sp. NPDC059240]|uniref:L,D-transpeptidase family protein n=1 Tax=Nocardia sp. NPDC059240 TaxID=3346786 RepID=UPI0036928B87
MPIARSRLVSAIMATAVLAAVAGCAGKPAPPEEQPAYSGPAEQLITVIADSATATTATLTAWNRSDTGSGTRWVRVIGPYRADVGAQGIGLTSETATRSPAGIWPLTEAFGIAADNGTKLPYLRVTDSDWWVSDVDSKYYNTHYSCAPGTCPFNESAGEDLGTAGPAYDHAVVIDYNRSPVVRGAGSAYFLHVGDGNPTAGCVALPGGELNEVMRWLDPARSPVIDIAVRDRSH